MHTFTFISLSRLGQVITHAHTHGDGAWMDVVLDEALVESTKKIATLTVD
jgi:hypothetical protein